MNTNLATPLDQTDTQQRIPTTENILNLFATPLAHAEQTSHRTRVGKIARLPHAVRTELNQRLRDGQPARLILPWLNALPEVRAVLEMLFQGQSISSQNLSLWRNGGFSDWLHDQERLERTERFATLASDLVKTDRGQILKGACTLAAAKILELLSDPHLELELEELSELIKSLTQLRSKDIAEQRVEISQQGIRCREQELELSEKKLAHSQRLYEDSLASEVEPQEDPWDETVDYPLTTEDQPPESSDTTSLTPTHPDPSEPSQIKANQT